jgi:putative transposase
MQAHTSLAFGYRCREAGVRPSMGSVGDAYDNALCESFFATLECELLDRQRFATPADARLAVFDFIEGWYELSSNGSRVGVRIASAKTNGAKALGLTIPQTILLQADHLIQ